MSSRVQSRSKFIWRIRILLIVIGAMAVLLAARLYFVQVVHGEEYRSAASEQYIATSAPVERRGDIYFRDKDGRIVTAATQQSGWRLAIQPNSLEDTPHNILAALTQIIPDIDEERFLKSAARSDDPYEEVAFRLSDTQAQAVRDLDLVGIVLAPERWRVYPAGERAAHVLGFVGFAGDTRIGRYGLERYWEDTLSRDGQTLYVNFFAELFSSSKSFISPDVHEQEGDIVTFIEPTVQQQLEETLAEVAETYNPKQLGGIVMNPQTGAVVAMATWPMFNPNTFNKEEDPAIFTNPMVEGVYEMGSIMKPLTMAAGLDSGAVTPGTTYYDAGYIMKSGERISNYDGRGRGEVDMQEVLNQSLNTGVAFVVDEMGEEQFAKYMKAYGLGEETGVDLPNEVRGLVSALDSPAEVDYASAAFGQGIAVTPIEMVRALSALANGGVMAEPHVADEIRFDSGLTKQVWRVSQERVLSTEAAEEITRMLVEVTDDALAGGELKQEHYRIATKTGTAQIAREGGGGYYEDRFLHSFFGYLPAHDAKYLVFLFAREPQGVRYASETWAEPFMQLAQFLINYYDIPPDR